MNRRRLAVLAVVIAVGLFGAPLVSPVPDYGPHLKVTTDKEPVKAQKNVTPIRYQNLSAPAQRLFDKAYNNSNTEADSGYGSTIGGDGPTVTLDEAPEPWPTLSPDNQGGIASTFITVAKNGQYYPVNLFRFTPGPSLQAVMLRLGPLLGAVGLGTAAGYFFLTAED